MRKKRPDLKRVFKIPGNPWVPILIALANIWLMLNLSVLTWIRFVVWLAVGFCIYFATATATPDLVRESWKLAIKSSLER